MKDESDDLVTALYAINDQFKELNEQWRTFLSAGKNESFFRQYSKSDDIYDEQKKRKISFIKIYRVGVEGNMYLDATKNVDIHYDNGDWEEMPLREFAEKHDFLKKVMEKIQSGEWRIVE